MGDSGILGDEFASTIRAACVRAREKTLKSGVPVFYHDANTGMDIMEQADGRKFEIRFLAGQPRELNFQILQELGRSAKSTDACRQSR